MLSRLLLAHSVIPVGSVASSAMPASETQKQRSVLLTVVFWTGVGLAPLAAALVLLSSGATGLRVAAVLAILAVVLIGLAIMLRPDAAGVRAEVEAMVFDELDGLRDAGRAAGRRRAGRRAGTRAGPPGRLGAAARGVVDRAAAAREDGRPAARGAPGPGCPGRVPRRGAPAAPVRPRRRPGRGRRGRPALDRRTRGGPLGVGTRSEEHTSELQSQSN